ncbi:hypothetical protein RCH16_003214 [Cryobacterium sp. MP_M5]|uniref:hypothetical protein n=1 Tax=unclassified Cryobacterium TaxID=2649013 RepID=UPI0018CA6ED2|nr:MULTISPECIES: hypothetical protein [unclassified Cryobacterium]MBG6059811.1 hypothetical protein [Cryobacterium sp. MP_M3]MEC5178183.1 hypothetical protein [Cryobacterium sp. MP_M5]
MATGLSPVEFTANPGYATPAAYSVAQRGGTACSAGNGVVPQPGGTAPGYRGVTVLVLPDAVAQWDRYASIYKYVISGAGAPYGDAAAVVCFGRGTESSCTANILVGTVWIDVVMEGIMADADADDAAVAARVQPLLARVTQEVTRAGAPAPLWRPPADAGNWVQLNALQGPGADIGDLEAGLSRLAVLVAPRING